MLSDSQKAGLMAELLGLKRFCVSLTGDAADADDLLQLTVERVLERGMPEDAHVAKWSYRVCRNLWLDELRSREVRQRYVAAASATDRDNPPAQQSARFQHLPSTRLGTAGTGA